MNTSQGLEIKYAKRLRASNREERKHLYAEAYRVVFEKCISELPKTPEKRTNSDINLKLGQLSVFISKVLSDQ